MAVYFRHLCATCDKPARNVALGKWVHVDRASHDHAPTAVRSVRLGDDAPSQGYRAGVGVSAVPCAHCQGEHPCIADVQACGAAKRDAFQQWLDSIAGDPSPGSVENACATRWVGASVTTSEQQPTKKGKP